MGLLLFYAAGIAATLWYTLFFLPFPELRENAGFSISIILLGFLSLLSFLVYRQESRFRSIFFQFWLLFAVLALAAPITYHCTRLYGPSGGIAAYVVMNIFVHGFFTWTICKIVLHYIFRDEKRWIINILASLVVLPTYIWLFWPYHFSPLTLLTLPTASDVAAFYYPVQKPMIVVNIVSLLLLMAFFLHKYRTDRPIGVFADTILFLFTLLIIVDTTELVAQISNLALLNASQWANSIIQTAMLVTLLLRLRYQTQTLTRYYESQCLSDNPDIGRRIGFFDRFVLWCFFDPKEIGKRIYLDTDHKKLTVKRSSSKVSRSMTHD